MIICKDSQGDSLANSGRIVVDSGKISDFQFRIFLNDLLFGHSCREPAKNIPDGDAQATDARLARTLPRLNSDSLAHGTRVTLSRR